MPPARWHGPLPDLEMRRVLGWREWLALPQLGIRDVKAKVDTGAKTSALHVTDMATYDEGQRVRFRVHPDVEGRATVEADAPVHEWRLVRDSGGHETQRPIVRTLCQIGDWEQEIEISITTRIEMGFRMLLGRQAIRHHFLIDPSLSYVASERFATHSLRPWRRAEPDDAGTSG